MKVNHSEQLTCGDLSIWVINCGDVWLKHLHCSIGCVPLLFNCWKLSRIEKGLQRWFRSIAHSSVVQAVREEVIVAFTLIIAHLNVRDSEKAPLAAHTLRPRVDYGARIPS